MIKSLDGHSKTTYTFLVTNRGTINTNVFCIECVLNITASENGEDITKVHDGPCNVFIIRYNL